MAHLPNMNEEQMRRFADALAFARKNQAMLRGKRSTLSLVNTESFRPFFEQLIEDPTKGLVIDRKMCFPNASLHTLYLKWQGAVQFLVESKIVDEEQRRLGSLIKTSFIAREDAESDALVVSLRHGRERTPKRAQEKAQRIVDRSRTAAPSTEWKNAFLEWASGGEVGVPFMRTDVALSSDDIEFVRSLCEQNEWEHDVCFTKIKTIKL